MVSGDDGFRSADSDLKKEVEEVEGSRLWDFTMGFMAIILSLSWRMEMIWALVMWEGMGVMVRVSVLALRTGRV